MKIKLKQRKKLITIAGLVAIVIVALLFLFKNQIFADTNTSTDWAIYPNNSASQPLVSNYIDVEIKNPTPGAQYYEIEEVGTVKGIAQWIDKPGEIIRLNLNSGLAANRKGTVELKLSAWNDKPANDGVVLKDYPDTISANFDFSFYNLTNGYNLTAESLDNGDVKIKATLKDPTLAPIAATIQQYTWGLQNSDGTDIWRSSTTVPEYTLPINSPTAAYVTLNVYGPSAYDEHGVYSAGGDAGGKIAIGVKKEDGTSPSINTTYSSNIFIASKTIPGDMRLPLLTDKIAMFSGGSLYIPVNMYGLASKTNPQYIEIDLPNGVNLNQPNQGATTQFSDVSSGATNLADGYHRYRLQKLSTNGSWGSQGTTQIFPTFSSSLISEKNLSIRLRAAGSSDQLSRTDNWQVQALTLSGIPQVTLPKRLVTQFAWTIPQTGFLLNSGTNGNIDDFLKLYKQLGFNTVPYNSIHGLNLQSPYLYSPEQRQTTPWQDMKYGPGDSLFYSNYLGTTSFFRLTISRYSALKDAQGNSITKTNFDAWADGLTLAQFNTQFRTQLTDANFLLEKTKWKNAIDYNIATGSPDMAYDGIFLQNDLTAVKNQMAITKPEYLFLDCETFPYYTLWLANIAKSANAQARKKPGEIDSALAARITDEFVSGFASAIRADSPETRISLYGFSAANGNLNYAQFIPWSMMQKYNLIPSPTYYGAVSLDGLGAVVRANRLVMPKGYEFIPWISSQTWSVNESPFMFDELIHLFLNGATGFLDYADFNIDDMANVLDMSRAIKLLSPYEDIIMDGDVAFGDISGTTNATVSAMKKDGQYLIGVTPKDQSKKVEFTISTSKNQNYLLTDEGTGTTESVSGQSIHVSKLLTEGKVFTLKVKPISTPTPTPSPSKTPTPSPSPSITATVAPSPSPSPSRTVTTIPSTPYIFPKGFSTLGVTKSLPSSSITFNPGLYVYQFDGAGNKWLMAPTDSFTLEPSKGYYVYNKQDAKTISLPYDAFSTNTYSLTKGWNMLYSSSTKQRSAIQLNHNNTGPTTIDSLIQQNKINSNVFIIDNDQSKDSCTYFSLLDTLEQSANCAISSPKKTKSIPAGKAFWVYVK